MPNNNLLLIFNTFNVHCLASLPPPPMNLKRWTIQNDTTTNHDFLRSYTFWHISFIYPLKIITQALKLKVNVSYVLNK
jgi:hypothetical protein